MSAGEVGEKSTGFREDRGVAVAAGVVRECLRDVGFADADGAVQDDGLSGGDVAAAGEVTDAGGRDFRVVAEVEIFDRCWLFELRLADASGDRGGVTSGDLVLAQ